jgi:S-adenosylmethionine:tRNA ribosyltransferase-isomerase
MYCLDAYQYQLPKELIAQVPAQRRDDARLLVLNRTTGSMAHGNMAGLEHYLAAGDVVVVNDTRVVPARLLGKKESGGKVELLVLHPATDQKYYRCLVKSSKGSRRAQSSCLRMGCGRGPASKRLRDRLG